MLFFSTAGAWSGGLGAVLGPGVVGRGWAQGWGNLPAPGPGQQLPSWVQGGDIVYFHRVAPSDANSWDLGQKGVQNFRRSPTQRLSNRPHRCKMEMNKK